MTAIAGKFDNKDLQASALFDVSHITAVVTGGGTGIGLSMPLLFDLPFV